MYGIRDLIASVLRSHTRLTPYWCKSQRFSFWNPKVNTLFLTPNLQLLLSSLNNFIRHFYVSHFITNQHSRRTFYIMTVKYSPQSKNVHSYYHSMCLKHSMMMRFTYKSLSAVLFSKSHKTLWGLPNPKSSKISSYSLDLASQPFSLHFLLWPGN